MNSPTRAPRSRNADRDGDGHTNLEEYLNGLCPNVVASESRCAR